MSHDPEVDLQLLSHEADLYSVLRKMDETSYGSVESYLNFSDPSVPAHNYRVALYEKLIADSKMSLAAAGLLAALCAAHGHPVPEAES
jgi:hypothetical protein